MAGGTTSGNTYATDDDRLSRASATVRGAGVDETKHALKTTEIIAYLATVVGVFGPVPVAASALPLAANTYGSSKNRLPWTEGDRHACAANGLPDALGASPGDHRVPHLA